jgi:hypothetical protein
LASHREKPTRRNNMSAKEVLFKILDEEGLKSVILEDLMDGQLKAKLDELVASSENSIDDALVAMVYPLLREEAAKFLDEKLAAMQA